MDKIYLVVSGEYSDYGVHGFFTDKTKAEKYCALKNSSDKCYDIYSVEECVNLQNGFIESGIVVKYEHAFYVDKHGVFRDYPYFDIVICSKGTNKIKNHQRKSGGHIVYVYLNEVNRDKALKIAQDMYAKFKAELSGL